nr:hypothetical protein [Tanacetum cinerariifolium]
MSIFAVIFQLAENASGGDVFDLIGDVDPTDKDRDIRMGDSTGVSAYLGGEIFSGGKKCQESNIGDSDNTGDGGNISYFTDFKEFDGGYVAFRVGAKGSKITSKGTIRIADESHVLLKVPRKNNMYSVDMKNIVPKKDLTCLVTKAINDESMLWNRRLGHINFKNINKLVKDNLVRGLPSKRFENDQTCIACLKGKKYSDETSRILKSFITEIENLVDKKVKMIRCDNGTEFKNRAMNELCEEKDIKREYSIARTPQQNEVAERRNKTLIEKKVLVVTPHFKNPYELLRGRTHALSFMRPFGCHVTILNTLDHLGNFDGKSDEGLFVGYFTNSKAFRVYNTRTRKVEENLHIKFLENKPLIVGDGPKWLFNIDTLTESMNYVPVITSTNSNDFAGKRASLDVDGDNKDNDGPSTESKIDNQERPNAKNSTKDVNTIGPSINTSILNINTASLTVNTVRLSDDFFSTDNDMRSLDGVELDISNISTIYLVPTTLNTRINKDYSLDNGCTQEKGIDYDEVFSPVARIEAIWLFLAYASFMGFLVYQMDVKSAFMYERIEEEVYVCQPTGFKDPDYPDKVYKVKKSLYGLHQAPRACQDKYVDEILRKFKYEDVKPANTPMDKEKVLLKDSNGDDVDVHLYRSMIGSLMYLISSRPDIMFVGCTYAKLQVKHITYEFDTGEEDDQYTTSVKTLDNGEIELNSTVDGHDKTITEASVKRHLKLADADGISTLPTTKIFKQLALIGKTKTTIGRMDIRIPQSNVPSRAVDEVITKEMHDRFGKAANTVSNLKAEQGSDKVTHLENELTSTKAVYNKALITLTKRVKKIEEIDKDKNVNLVKSSKQGEAHETAKHIMDFSTTSPQIDDDETLAETLLNIKRSVTKDNGKAIMQESESPKKIKKKEMMQISLDEEIAKRFVPMESEGQAADSKAGEGSSKEGESLKRSAEEDLGQEQKVEEIAQQEDVVAKQAEKEGSKNVGGRLKRKTLKSREDKDKIQKKQDDPEKLTHMEQFNEKYASTRPGFDDLILWGDMKIMFEPDGDDEKWSRLEENKGRELRKVLVTFTSHELAGFENRPPMLNKEDYVLWSSRLLCYAKSKPNGKLIHNSIINGPYVRRMNLKPGDPNCEVPVNETFHVQTDDELTEKKLKQIEADDQAIQTIILGLPEDIYATVDSCETAQEIRNLKFLNNLQPEWSRHVIIIHQTKDLHTADYTQLYDFLKYNQKEVDDLKAERLARTQDPLEFMETSNNPYTFPVLHQDQPSFNQNYMQQPMPDPEDITDPTTAMNMALAPMAKAFKLNYSTPINNNQRISSNPPRAEGNTNRHNGNQIRCYNCRGVGHFARNCTVRPRRRVAAYLQTQLVIAQKEVYTELLEPIPEPHQVPHNDNNVISEDSSMEQSWGTVEQHPVNVEKTRALYDSLYNNLAIEVEKVNTVNRKLSESNAELTTELTRYKNQERCFAISQEKYDKLERCYQKSVYQEQCLSKKINALHLSFANVSKTISIPNEEFLDDTTPSVAWKFLNEVKSTTVTLQRVVKQIMTLKTHNWSSSAHQELHKIVKDETFSIVNQVDARVQNFEIQFLKEAAKFVGDFKSLAKESDESLANQKALELEIERLLRAVVSQDIMSVVQNNSVGEMSNLQTEFERKPPKVGETHALSKPVTSNSIPIPQGSEVVKNAKVIAPGMFRINPFKPSREEKHVPKKLEQALGKIRSLFHNLMSSLRKFLGLDLTYAPSTITTQQPTEGELDLLFEDIYEDYIGGQPLAVPRTVPAAQAHPVRPSSTTSTSIADTAPTPTNSSS